MKEKKNSISHHSSIPNNNLILFDYIVRKSFNNETKFLHRLCLSSIISLLQSARCTKFSSIHKIYIENLFKIRLPVGYIDWLRYKLDYCCYRDLRSYSKVVFFYDRCGCYCYKQNFNWQNNKKKTVTASKAYSLLIFITPLHLFQSSAYSFHKSNQKYIYSFLLYMEKRKKTQDKLKKCKWNLNSIYDYIFRI